MKFFRQILLLYFILLCYLNVNCSAEDLTLAPKSSGSDVVEAVITKLRNSGIFESDKRLLTRIAWVESKFGTDKIYPEGTKKLRYKNKHNYVF